MRSTISSGFSTAKVGAPMSEQHVDRSLFTGLRPRDDLGRLIPRTLEQYTQAFWKRVKVGHALECWPWLGPRHKKGYGEIAKSEVMPERKAHRVAYTLAKGPIPAGALLMHACDYPPCCNPAHLSPGTGKENTRDCIDKSRRARQPTTKLTADDVLQIRAIGNTATRKAIGLLFGISGRNVLSILRRESWNHIA